MPDPEWEFSPMKFFTAVFSVLGASALVGILALITVTVVFAIRANGETDYCWVNYYSPQGMPAIYELHGHRPWNPDREIAKFNNIDEAVKAATTIQCPLQRKP